MDKKEIFRLVTFAVIGLLLLVGCSKPNDQSGFGQTSSGAKDTSIAALIATPERYSGKMIRITGVMILELEGNAIYVSKSDAGKHVFKNSIWLELDHSKLGIPENEPSDPEQLKQAISKAKRLKGMSGKYVILEGIFDKDSRGHLGLFSGTVNVTRIEQPKVDRN